MGVVYAAMSSDRSRRRVERNCLRGSYLVICGGRQRVRPLRGRVRCPQGDKRICTKPEFVCTRQRS